MYNNIIYIIIIIVHSCFLMVHCQLDIILLTVDEVLIIIGVSSNSFSCKAITDYIDQQFERYLQEELKIKRGLVTFHDTRIHACLYFICPTGHS